MGFFHFFGFFPQSNNHISFSFGKAMFAADNSVKKEKEVQ